MSKPEFKTVEFGLEYCPACHAKLERRKRESVRVFAIRKFCNQKCYFDAVRAKLADAGRPFEKGNRPKPKGYLAHT